MFGRDPQAGERPRGPSSPSSTVACTTARISGDSPASAATEHRRTPPRRARCSSTLASEPVDARRLRTAPRRGPRDAAAGETSLRDRRRPRASAATSASPRYAPAPRQTATNVSCSTSATTLSFVAAAGQAQPTATARAAGRGSASATGVAVCNGLQQLAVRRLHTPVHDHPVALRAANGSHLGRIMSQLEAAGAAGRPPTRRAPSSRHGSNPGVRAARPSGSRTRSPRPCLEAREERSRRARGGRSRPPRRGHGKRLLQGVGERVPSTSTAFADRVLAGSWRRRPGRSPARPRAGTRGGRPRSRARRSRSRRRAASRESPVAGEELDAEPRGRVRAPVPNARPGIDHDRAGRLGRRLPRRPEPEAGDLDRAGGTGAPRPFPPVVDGDDSSAPGQVRARTTSSCVGRRRRATSSTPPSRSRSSKPCGARSTNRARSASASSAAAPRTATRQTDVKPALRPRTPRAPPTDPTSAERRSAPLTGRRSSAARGTRRPRHGMRRSRARPRDGAPRHAARAVRRVGTRTSTRTRRSPLRPVSSDGIPRPRTAWTAPGCIPGASSISSGPSGVGTETVVPSAAPVIVTEARTWRSSPSRSTASSGRRGR